MISLKNECTLKMDSDCLFIYDFISFAFKTFRKCISGDSIIVISVQIIMNDQELKKKTSCFFVELSERNTINMLYSIFCFNIQRLIITLT